MRERDVGNRSSRGVLCSWYRFCHCEFFSVMCSLERRRLAIQRVLDRGFILKTIGKELLALRWMMFVTISASSSSAYIASDKDLGLLPSSQQREHMLERQTAPWVEEATLSTGQRTKAMEMKYREHKGEGVGRRWF